MIYIFWSCRNKEEAEKLIEHLVEKRLVACASIFPAVESIYRWEGKVEKQVETKVILKTRETHFEAISDYIKKHGSYDVPEVLQVSIEKGSPEYMKWVLDVT